MDCQQSAEREPAARAVLESRSTDAQPRATEAQVPAALPELAGCLPCAGGYSAENKSRSPPPRPRARAILPESRPEAPCGPTQGLSVHYRARATGVWAPPSREPFTPLTCEAPQPPGTCVAGSQCPRTPLPPHTACLSGPALLSAASPPSGHSLPLNTQPPSPRWPLPPVPKAKQSLPSRFL